MFTHDVSRGDAMQYELCKLVWVRWNDRLICFRYDRTLGGVEFQLRLRDYLAEQFNKVKRTKKDVTSDARAMQKLFKEAGRVKQVLSANTDHFAQVMIVSCCPSYSEY